MLAVKGVAFRERNFKCKTNLWKEWNLKREREHGAEVRNTDSHMRTRHARKLSERFIKLLERHVFEHLERTHYVMRFVGKRQREHTADDIRM